MATKHPVKHVIAALGAVGGAVMAVYGWAAFANDASAWALSPKQWLGLGLFTLVSVMIYALWSARSEGNDRDKSHADELSKEKAIAAAAVRDFQALQAARASPSKAEIELRLHMESARFSDSIISPTKNPFADEPALYIFIMGTITNSGEVPSAALDMKVEIVADGVVHDGQMMRIVESATLSSGGRGSPGIRLDPKDNLHSAALVTTMNPGDVRTGFVAARFPSLSRDALKAAVSNGKVILRWSIRDVRQKRYTTEHPMEAREDPTAPWHSLAGMNSVPFFDDQTEGIGSINDWSIVGSADGGTFLVAPQASQPPAPATPPQPNPPQSSK